MRRAAGYLEAWVERPDRAWPQRLAVLFACAVLGNAVVVALLVASVAAAGAAVGEGPVLLRFGAVIVACLLVLAAWKARAGLVRVGLAVPLRRRK